MRFVRGSDFNPSPPWENEGQVAPDALRHFRDRNRELSIYRIEDTDRLPDLVAAHALGNQENLKKYDAYLVDEATVTKEFPLRETPGTLPDDEANTWHRQLDELSEEGVRRLTFLFYAHGEIRRFTVANVVQLACRADRAGRVRRDAMSEGVLRDLEKAQARVL